MSLRLTRRAEGDLDRIAAYLQERSPQGARHVQESIRAAFRLLAAHPLAGATISGRLRRLLVERYPYIIFYRVDDGAQRVSIVTVRHAARRPIA